MQVLQCITRQLIKKQVLEIGIITPKTKDPSDVTRQDIYDMDVGGPVEDNPDSQVDATREDHVDVGGPVEDHPDNQAVVTPRTPADTIVKTEPDSGHDGSTSYHPLDPQNMREWVTDRVRRGLVEMGRATKGEMPKKIGRAHV